MTTIQMRHIKLWFAGKLKNWDLADYELNQIRQSLEDAATLYSGIPVEYVGATVDPIKAMWRSRLATARNSPKAMPR
jgi:hypothetical protein